MIDTHNKTTGSRILYRSPEVRVVFVKAQDILCQSENQSMSEKDYGDGGFEEQ